MLGECHAHLFMNGINYKEAVATHKNGVCKEAVREEMEKYKRLGITYVRDGGDNLGVSVYARSIAPEYGIEYRSPIFAIHKNGYYGGIVGKGFDTIDEYALLVKEVKKEKGDFIKIMASGILDFDRFGKVSTPLRDEALIGEMIRIAHEEGFSVMVHVNTPEQIIYAAAGGCDSIEHGYYMDDAARRVMHENRTVWVPTIATCANLRKSTRFNKEAVEQITASHMEGVRKALKAGVLIATGSDAGAFMVPHGKGLLDEIDILHEACRQEPELIPVLEATLTEGLSVIMKKFRRD